MTSAKSIYAPKPACNARAYRPLVALFFSLWFCAAPAAFGAGLTAIDFSRISGQRLQINLRFDTAPRAPSVFRTADPARIVLDFPAATNHTGKRRYKIRTAALRSADIAVDSRKLRLILHLTAAVAYRLQPTNDGFALTLGAVASAADTVAARGAPTQTQPRTPPAHQIRAIDMRRKANGGGRVIIKLSDQTLAADVREDGGDIVIAFADTGLPQKLERRLNVLDFATPIHSIDSYADGNNVNIVINTNDRQRHTATQSGDTLFIDVNPLSREEIEDEQRAESEYEGELLSLSFQDTDIRSAIAVFADFTNLNIVIADNVSGNITIRLADVPWDEAFDTILQTKGLAYRREPGSNILRVGLAEEILEREKKELTAKFEARKLEPLVSEIFELSHVKAEDVAELLKSVRAVETGVNQPAFGSVSFNEIKTEENNLLSERGSVSVAAQINAIVVQDTERQLRQIREIIARLDVPVRQVLIESRIVQANDGFSKNIGTRLGLTQITQQAEIGGTGLGDVYASGSIENTNRVRSEGVTEVNDDALGVNLAAGGIGAEAAAQYAFTLAKLNSGVLRLIDLEISALQVEGKGRVIATPKILTKDNAQASIEQGEERTQIVAGGLAGATQGTQKAALNLTVTPQITRDNSVNMEVQISNDFFRDAEAGLIGTTRIQTQVLLENGETVMIGGIYNEDQGVTVTKVPLLGDIPFLGRLFRKTATRDNRTELLVLLTPRIFDPDLALQ